VFYFVWEQAVEDVPIFIIRPTLSIHSANETAWWLRQRVCDA